jgi:hypothetical protein
MTSFSERYGYKDPRSVFQRDTLDRLTSTFCHRWPAAAGSRRCGSRQSSRPVPACRSYRSGCYRRTPHLPKGTSFEDLAQAGLDGIVEEIDNRPLGVLGWAAPGGAFQEQPESLQTEACCASG